MIPRNPYRIQGGALSCTKLRAPSLKPSASELEVLSSFCCMARLAFIYSELALLRGRGGAATTTLDTKNLQEPTKTGPQKQKD